MKIEYKRAVQSAHRLFIEIFLVKALVLLETVATVLEAMRK